MLKLTDFKPIAQLVLPDLGKIECSGLILVVGPNSSGKSQLLQDIYRRTSGEPRKLVVAEDITLARPPIAELVDSLVEAGFLSSYLDDNGTRQLQPMTTYAGTGEAVAPINFNQAASWYSSMPPSGAHKTRIDFLYYFGRLLTTALFLEKRLTAGNQVGLIDFEAQPPQTDLHALYVDDKARGELLAEIVASFGKAVWPDISRGNSLSLKVSDQGVLPSPSDRLSHKQMARFRSIETEGDGLKSYVATCIALLLGRRPVCIIDEPEMCLHPPQAYNLGRFIGRFGASTETVTFVATHSSSILRGVIQTTERVQIVRLTRKGSRFHAHRVSPEELQKALDRPTLRAVEVLDGIFSQAVALVEADTDRQVYEAVWETVAGEFGFDLHLTAVGGTGGLADSCALYKTLSIPTVVIADLDFLSDVRRVRKVVDSIASDSAITDTIVAETTVILGLLRKLTPNATAEEVRSALAEISALEMNWEVADDFIVRGRLNELAQRVDRLKRFKKGGLASLPQEIATPLKVLLAKLSEIGVFLVPVGELEEWLREYGIKASHSRKPQWANEAAQRVRALGARTGDVWDFMRSAGSYLQSRV